jgi:hypothetical protein
MVETLTWCSKTGTKTAGCALKSQNVCDAGRSGCVGGGGGCTFEEDVSCVVVGGNALEEGEGIADSI